MEEKWIHKFDYVNSSYILQYIFSFLEETKKLYIIINNKAIQKRMEVDLDYYKKISGKYKEVGENGIGKLYRLDDNKLIFEGEYKHGKKNGKGKEFYELGYVKFEGEYINGEKIKGKGYNTSGKVIMEIDDGKGKEYYNNGKIQFEGEYKNGKRWNGKGYDYNGNETFEIKDGKGWGNEYNYYGNLIYKGGFLYGKKYGKGTLYWNNIIEYEGEFINDLKNGQGKEYDVFNNRQLIYEGNYLNGKWNGNGKKYNEKGILVYEGGFMKGKRNGEGKEYDEVSGELIFEGEYLNDMKYKGKEYKKGELRFEGEYLNGCRYNGKGKETDINAQKILVFEFEGEYINGKLVGKAKKYYDNQKIKFEGEYKDGVGKEYYDNGKICYEGEYLSGQRHGKGKEYDKNGKLIYEGEFIYDQREGIGKEYNEKGLLIFEGEYKNGTKYKAFN